MRVALAQPVPTPGDIPGNLATMLAFTDLARDAGADLVVFPDHVLDGNVNGSLSGSHAFLETIQEALRELAAAASLPLITSTVSVDESSLGQVVETCYVVRDNTVASFPARSDRSCGTARIDHLDLEIFLGYEGLIDRSRADVTVFLAAEPYRGEPSVRVYEQTVADAGGESCSRGGYHIWANLAGGQDGLVLGGASFITGPDGDLVARCRDFSTDIVFAEIGRRSRRTPPFKRHEPAAIHPVHKGKTALDYHALVAATRDYLGSNGFTDCLVGLSGGIDSALVATIAADALGADHVHCVLMPGPHSSEGSVTDAMALAANLGLDAVTVPISGMFESGLANLGPFCGGEVTGVARENLQSRIRTLCLMTLSNTYGWMLVNTGNKSEAAMGFSTLYGDTAGAFAPLGDVYKTDVFALARYRNRALGEVIPQAIIDKAPSAELYDGQRDDDRLPPYDLLDPLLAAHVEGGMDRGELISAGFGTELVDRVLPMVSRFEFKRRQEPLSPQISPFSFSERAWPVTNRFIDKTE